MFRKSPINHLSLRISKNETQKKKNNPDGKFDEKNWCGDCRWAINVKANNDWAINFSSAVQKKKRQLGSPVEYFANGCIL